MDLAQDCDNDKANQKLKDLKEALKAPGEMEEECAFTMGKRWDQKSLESKEQSLETIIRMHSSLMTEICESSARC